jgi:phospholipid/cholesterol/gamma-HCH transport system substrate-binding protein
MLKEEDVRFKHLEKKIGLFVIVAVVGLLVAVLFIAIERDLFTQMFRLRFTVEKGTGFAKGMSVKLSGFRIGKISAISLNEKAMVDIDLQIDKKYQKWIRNDSTARLVKEGLVGDSIVEVSVGSQGKPMLKDGDHITFAKTKGLEEVANDIADQVKPVLYEVKEIISYINDPQGDIKQTLGNINRLTRDLNGTRGHVDNLLVSTRGDIGRAIDSTQTVLKSTDDKIKALGPSLEKVERTLTNIDQKLPPMLDKVNASLENVEKSTRTIGKSMPGLISKTEDTVQSVDTLLNALKQTWPFKNHISPPSDREFVPGDSNE